MRHRKIRAFLCFGLAATVVLWVYASTGKRQPTIAKVSLQLGEQSRDVYPKAWQTHIEHNQLHGYGHFLGTELLIDEEDGDDNNMLDPFYRSQGSWSKPAFLTSILLQELNKPVEKRLKFLFWFDADTIVMNAQTKLESFLPPEPDFNNIHLLVTEDWNGINAGVIALRVNSWSASLMAAVMSFPHYQSDADIGQRDQTALSEVLHVLPYFQQNWTTVPSHWFNSYACGSSDNLTRNNSKPWCFVQGDFIAHFPGADDKQTEMLFWLDKAAHQTNLLPDTDLMKEIAIFWERKRDK